MSRSVFSPAIVLCLGGWLALPLPGQERGNRPTWSQLPSLPDARGLGGMFAGVSGETLLVAGGDEFPGQAAVGRRHEVVVRHGLRALGGPRRLAPRRQVAAAAGLRRLRRDGSRRAVRRRRRRRSGITPTPSCCSGNRAPSTFDPLPPLPQPSAYLCGAQLGNVVYLAGGAATRAATSALQTFWALDLADPKPSGGNWSLGRGRVGCWRWPASRPERSTCSAVRSCNGRCRRQARPPLSVRRLPFHARPTAGDRRRTCRGPSWPPLRPRGDRAVASVDLQRRRRHQSRLPAARRNIPAFPPSSWPTTRSPTLGSDGQDARAARDHAGGQLARTVGDPQRRNPARRAFAGGLELSAAAATDRLRLAELRGRWPPTWSGVVAIGVYCSRFNRTTDDFFRGGQSIPWWAAG